MAAFAGAPYTAGVAIPAGAVGAVVDIHDGLLHSPVLLVHVVALLVVSGFVIAFRTLRDRDPREPAQVRAVSETAQRVLLRPLPDRMGPLEVAPAYRAAERYVRTSSATRFLIGDVRGKGLPAIDDASAVLGAFREAAHRRTTLPEPAPSLEDSVRRHLTQIAETGQEAGEHFITALIVEIPDEIGTIGMISCGHPPPLLAHAHRVTALHTDRPAPPPGLAGLIPDAYQLHSFPFHAADTLLLCTDGAIEARSSAGAFYPIGDRAVPWAGDNPQHLVRHILHDLQIYTGGRPDDDLAMVAIRRPPLAGRGPGAQIGRAHV